MNADGEEVNTQNSEAIKEELSEKITKIEVLYGSKANYLMTQFIKKILENYRQ